MAKKFFRGSKGLQVDNSIAIIHGVGAPGSYGGDPDVVAPGSLYTDDADGVLYRKHVAGTGTTVWSIVASEKAPTTVTGVTVTQVLIDEVPTKKTKSMKWTLDLEDDIAPEKRTYAEVSATHDGSDLVDAVSVQWTINNEMEMNGGVGTYTVQVKLAGSAANQTMQLWVSQ